ncbi:hypothetical protein [Vreelandella alkaliphila]|uniref:Uncharacterized protein n=1 Tax=Vreelandella alkaliphila TaxID=272774 RepID=A0AAJ2RPT7_9GAMM|nr:hypothetical protein [Halomonas alkaliphila]MDX5976023.1 hypothetical protein [Halomonas alkaliphila]
MLNELYLTGILRTMREEAETSERREEDIRPAALVQYAQMIEDSVYKGAAAMTRTTTNDYARQLENTISDYTQQLEQMTLAGEDLLKLESLLKAIVALLDKDAFDLAQDAERLACVGHELAKYRAEYFMDAANCLEATISQLEVEVEEEKEKVIFVVEGEE